mgnify:FL=1
MGGQGRCRNYSVNVSVSFAVKTSLYLIGRRGYTNATCTERTETELNTFALTNASRHGRHNAMYQRRKNNKYILPNAVYNHTIWQIRDYKRLKQALALIPQESPAPPDGMPQAQGFTGDPVYQKVAKMEDIRKVTDAIEQELLQIPKEYRQGVWESITERKRFPDDADRSTYGRYKSKYVYSVAVRLNYL